MEFTKRRNVNRGLMKLEAWQRAQAFVKLAKEIVDRNSTIGFRLQDQILDATHSLPSNIAKGYCRRSINEYIQFCYVSLGSAGEVMSRMISLNAGKQVSEPDFESFAVLHWEVENRLIVLVRSLEQKRDEGTWNQEMP